MDLSWIYLRQIADKTAKWSLAYTIMHSYDISVSEMTYTVSSGTLNSTISYHSHDIVFTWKRVLNDDVII